MTGAERTALVRQALDDRDYTVRFDALRAWVRRETEGARLRSDCRGARRRQPAPGAGGDRCAGRSLRDRRRSRDAHDPAAQRAAHAAGHRSWHREAHALVAAAKRVPERAAMAIPAFRTHNLWQVRMYAARAADPLKDVARSRSSPTTTTTTCARRRWCRCSGIAGAERSQPAFIAALGRHDYQLVRTAAIGVKGADVRQVRSCGPGRRARRASPRRIPTRRATRGSR